MLRLGGLGFSRLCTMSVWAAGLRAKTLQRTGPL